MDQGIDPNESGEPHHQNAALFEQLYEEIRSDAHRQLDRLCRGHLTADPTELVHEAFQRVLAIHSIQWKDATHFRAMVARTVRRVFLDYRRRRNAARRLPNGNRIALDEEVNLGENDFLDLLSVQDAIEVLKRDHPRESTVLELQSLAGLSVAEIATSQRMSETTVKRRLQVARARLRKILDSPGGEIHES